MSTGSGGSSGWTSTGGSSFGCERVSDSYRSTRPRPRVCLGRSLRGHWTSFGIQERLGVKEVDILPPPRDTVTTFVIHSATYISYVRRGTLTTVSDSNNYTNNTSWDRQVFGTKGAWSCGPGESGRPPREPVRRKWTRGVEVLVLDSPERMYKRRPKLRGTGQECE